MQAHTNFTKKFNNDWTGTYPALTAIQQLSNSWVLQGLLSNVALYIYFHIVLTQQLMSDCFSESLKNKKVCG